MCCLQVTHLRRVGRCVLPKPCWQQGMKLCVFFYQDGVLTASNNLVVAQDQQDIAKQWQAFITENKLDAVVCIAAALRRGVLDQAEAQRYQREAVNLADGYQLSGLGQLHDALQQADRCISFGGE